MSKEMAGKVAIVTGGARGLGRGIAELFVEEGAKIVIADLRDEDGEALAARLGDAARYHRTDVSQREQVQALVDYAVKEFGRLDAMVNNAGITDTSYGRLIDNDFASFDPVMKVNVLGIMLGTQIAARAMAKTGGGAIVNLSSISAVRPGFGFFSYRASKAAVSAFSQSAAIELAEHNIRVNVICPGNVPTEMGTYASAPGENPEKGRRIAQAVSEVRMGFQPLKRQATPRDIGEAALWFASDRSPQVTGQIMSVDGGATIGDTQSQIGAIMEARAKVEAEFG
jgi:NAD(P)-dependent dehydrogenase (short-subunit alcohol dehydrogenase family)